MRKNKWDSCNIQRKETQTQVDDGSTQVRQGVGETRGLIRKLNQVALPSGQPKGFTISTISYRYSLDSDFSQEMFTSGNELSQLKMLCPGATIKGNLSSCTVIVTSCLLLLTRCPISNVTKQGPLSYCALLLCWGAQVLLACCKMGSQVPSPHQKEKQKGLGQML